MSFLDKNKNAKDFLDQLDPDGTDEVQPKKPRKKSTVSYRHSSHDSGHKTRTSAKAAGKTNGKTRQAAKTYAGNGPEEQAAPEAKTRPYQEPVKKQQKKPKKKQGCLTPVIILLVIIALSYVVVRASLAGAFSKMERTPLAKENLEVNTTDKNMKGYQNIVLFGVDNQDNVISDIGSRTDSIIIASIKKSNKKVKLMSIYRDTYVSIDGNYDKINAAYSYGGPEMAIRTINRNLDLNITDFATVNFKALADAVDILGGIKLTIKDETELKNLNDYIGNMNKINGGDSEKFDEPGTYTFDGNQAVAYSRIRYMAGGDHERANHQRLVIQGIMNKAKTRPWKIPELTSVVLPQCKTSLSSNEMASLTMSMIRMDLGDSEAYPFHSVDERYNGIYYGFPITVESNVKQAHELLFGTKDYSPCEELTRISEKVKVVTDALGY